MAPSSLTLHRAHCGCVGRLQAQLQASLEQYELREKHFEKLLRTKELEKQLAEAQAAQALQAHKADLLAAQERDMVAKEVRAASHVTAQDSRLVRPSLDCVCRACCGSD